ncbi:MAG: sugar nucleotide-binding protein [Rickettsiaceae bacterium]|nr:sugar nucleotide-binding protein [Rickettsiaceae bacterium]
MLPSSLDLPTNRIVIIGAGGNIGTQLLKSASLNKMTNLIPVTRVPDKSTKNQIDFDFEFDSPVNKLSFIEENDVVVILAGITKPNLVFEDKEKSRLINVEKMSNLIDFLRDKQCKVIFVSSVEVFDGHNAPYSEKSFRNPLNLYGKQKAEIELKLERDFESSQYKIIRIPWNVSLDLHSNCLVTNTYRLLMSNNSHIAKDYDSSIIYTEGRAELILKLAINYNLIQDIVLNFASDQFINRLELVEFIIKKSSVLNNCKYSVTKFHRLQLIEPRARDTRLYNQRSKDIFQFIYTDAWTIIDKKIELIDRLYS